MKAKLVGKKKSSFTDRQTGEVIQNNKLHLIDLRPMVAEGNDQVDGYEVSEVGTQLDISSLKVGKSYDLDFKTVTYGKSSRLKLQGWEELPEAN